ncbi:hypothetical protein [Anaerotalea alkaliphila]|uniref:YD repeat-containing protein n=1 Tax=Anaerotalea alkaliphila TaxID=2662126 RepID=A0A7X5HVX3_9FIRM|nr:hypothetical protein [Anaerotalea alkaliphila]NDL67573.1 hypothetical protein [Anaerotalea alkaliphila]
MGIEKRVSRYTYDESNRLTGVVFGDYTGIRYIYDEEGNRVEERYGAWDQEGNWMEWNGKHWEREQERVE